MCYARKIRRFELRISREFLAQFLHLYKHDFYPKVNNAYLKQKRGWQEEEERVFLRSLESNLRHITRSE